MAFHVTPLLGRWFMWNMKPYFLRKKKYPSPCTFTAQFWHLLLIFTICNKEILQVESKEKMCITININTFRVDSYCLSWMQHLIRVYTVCSACWSKYNVLVVIIACVMILHGLYTDRFRSSLFTCEQCVTAIDIIPCCFGIMFCKYYYQLWYTFSFCYVNRIPCLFLEVISRVIKSRYMLNISKSSGYTCLGV